MVDDLVQGRDEQGPGPAVVQVLLPAAKAAGRDRLFRTHLPRRPAANRTIRRREDRDQVQAVIADRTAFGLAAADQTDLGQDKIQGIAKNVLDDTGPDKTPPSLKPPKNLRFNFFLKRSYDRLVHDFFL